MSDIYARAYHHVSSTCHPQWMTCMQERGTQNPSQTIPWSILQRTCKTHGPPLVSPIDSHHHVSSTCHPQWVTCMQEHNTYTTHETYQTQAPRLLILISPRPVLGKPPHSPVGLTKPRKNTSLVKGSANPRFNLGEPFLLLSASPTGTQGTQGPPLIIFPIPNFYLCRNTSLSKTQGPSLVLTSPKPKVRPWYTFLQNPRSTLVHNFTKPKVHPWYTFLQNPRHPLGSLTCSNVNNHRQGSKFKQTNCDPTIWKDL